MDLREQAQRRLEGSLMRLSPTTPLEKAVSARQAVEDLIFETLRAVQEATLPSSPDTTQQEDAQSGESTSSVTYSLAKEGLTGRLRITATDTSAGRSLIQALGDELKHSQDGIWTLTEHSTLESQWHFGRLLSTPEAAQDGPSASTSEASDPEQGERYRGLPSRTLGLDA